MIPFFFFEAPQNNLYFVPRAKLQSQHWLKNHRRSLVGTWPIVSITDHQPNHPTDTKKIFNTLIVNFCKITVNISSSNLRKIFMGKIFLEIIRWLTFSASKAYLRFTICKFFSCQDNSQTSHDYWKCRFYLLLLFNLLKITNANCNEVCPLKYSVWRPVFLWSLFLCEVPTTTASPQL